MRSRAAAFFLTAALLLSACGTPETGSPPGEGVLATTTILGDIAQNVAGERLQVESLLPRGADPHEYQLTPQDAARIAGSRLLIVNGAGYEGWLQETLDNVGGERLIATASEGTNLRTSAEGQDPHLWMDPNNVVEYVENIRLGLSRLDPAGADVYSANAAAYTTELQALDAWIRAQVATIPPEGRLLVTNHDSLGYFADRYGFTVIGTILPGLSSEASPSARQIAALIEAIKAARARAVFLDAGDNPHLADQVSAETGLPVVTDLYIESLSPAGGPASTYIEMIKHDVTRIVDALK
jgi:ABC-type Zn uptake system ZnuABC Zn-binding protein ZnuA